MSVVIPQDTIDVLLEAAGIDPRAEHARAAGLIRSVAEVLGFYPSLMDLENGATNAQIDCRSSEIRCAVDDLRRMISRRELDPKTRALLAVKGANFETLQGELSSLKNATISLRTHLAGKKKSGRRLRSALRQTVRELAQVHGRYIGKDNRSPDDLVEFLRAALFDIPHPNSKEKLLKLLKIRKGT